MFNKKMLFLAVGYIAGGLVSSLYGDKKPQELKKELKKAKKSGDNDFSFLVDNFIETHKHLLDDFKTQVLTEENKKLINEHKDNLLQVVDSYKSEGKNIMEELKVQGKTFIVEASEKLEKVYEDKKDEIDALKEVSPEKVSELKGKLLASFEDFKKKIK